MVATYSSSCAQKAPLDRVVDQPIGAESQWSRAGRLNFAQMEMTAHCLSHAKLPKPLIKFSSPPLLRLFQSKASFLASSSVPFQSSRTFVAQLQCVGIKARQQRNLGAIHASETESPPTDIAERWLLVPVGQLALSFPYCKWKFDIFSFYRRWVC